MVTQGETRCPFDRIRIVLVEPKVPGNIGSVARAMVNMGLSRLCLVGPADHRSGEARKMAIGAGHILYGANVYETLEEALSGTVLVAGTTHKRRRHFDLQYGPRHVAERLAALPEGREGALVFGREESGLTNDELKLCHIVSRIHTPSRYPSFNLAQAVLIFAYEIYQAALEPPQAARLDLAGFEEIETMYAHISSTLDRLGVSSRHHPDSFVRSIRRLFGRIGLERRDVATLHRMFRQVDKFVARHGLDGGSE